MASILVFQHVAAEPLGTLDALIRKRGHRIRFVNFDREPMAQVDVSRYAGLIVLGGPMMVSDRSRLTHLQTEISALRRAVEIDLPVLGICLGAQLLAHALGAEVGPLAQPEIGWYPLTPTRHACSDNVLGALDQPRPVFQWHSHGFSLPAGATALARSEHCPCQAFRVQRAYGFQFHLEMEQKLVDRWLHIPAYQSELKAAQTFSLEAIQEQTQQHMPQLNTLAGQVFNPFLDLIAPPRQRVTLPSR
ncbi:MAG: type 1 glutamine amidotransferase [Lysobacterales bacterium]